MLADKILKEINKESFQSIHDISPVMDFNDNSRMSQDQERLHVTFLDRDEFKKNIDLITDVHFFYNKAGKCIG